MRRASAHRHEPEPMASTRSVAVQQSQGRREHVDAFARPPRPPAVEGEHDQEAVLLASSPWPQRSLRARRRGDRRQRRGCSRHRAHNSNKQTIPGGKDPARSPRRRRARRHPRPDLTPGLTQGDLASDRLTLMRRAERFATSHRSPDQITAQVSSASSSQDPSDRIDGRRWLPQTRAGGVSYTHASTSPGREVHRS